MKELEHNHQGFVLMEPILERDKAILLTLGARGDILTQYIASTLQVLGLKT